MSKEPTAPKPPDPAKVAARKATVMKALFGEEVDPEQAKQYRDRYFYVLPGARSFRGISINQLGPTHSCKDQHIVYFNGHTPETLIHAIYRCEPYLGLSPLAMLQHSDLIPFAKKKVMEIYDEAIRLTNLDNIGGLYYRGRRDPSAYIKRGLALVTLGEHIKAIKDYSEAIHRYPYSSGLLPEDVDSNVWIYAETLYLRGTAYHAVNQYKNAMLDYTKAIFFDPVNVDAFYNRALLHWQSGEHQKAIDDYTRAIGLDPHYTNAYYNRANSYLQLGQQKKAINDYTTVLRLDPTSYNTYYTRALAYEKLGQHEEAINDYTEVIRLVPEKRWSSNAYKLPSVLRDHENPYFKRAVLYLKLGQYEKAIKDFDFDKKRYHGSNSYQRGIAYAKLGQYEHAINDFNGVLIHERRARFRSAMLNRLGDPLTNLYADTYYYRGLSYEKLGDKEKAIKDYKEAVAFNPRHKKAINKKSELLAKMNK